MRRTFEIGSEPRGRTYDDLLYRAFPWCAELWLVVVPLPGGGDPLLPRAHGVLRELEPYQTGVTDQREWPGTHLEGGATGRVHRFRLHPEVLDVLAGATDRLYAWRHPELPQDLALVRGDGTPFLATVTNEGWAALTLDDDERQVLSGDLPELGLRDLWG
ncbi:MAG: hypothetical protein HYU87_09355 [Chloroflexi bacterium]|nr:hypothetical protein [Chloroflexota bacterium]